MPDTITDAITESAWYEAVRTFRAWRDTTERIIRASRRGEEAVDPFDRAEQKRLRTILDEMVADHDWRRTYVDPMVTDTNRAAYLSPVYTGRADRLPEFAQKPLPAPVLLHGAAR